MATPGIQSASRSFVVAIIDAVRAFDDFAKHMRRLHKHIIATMETEDRALIEKLQLMA